MNVKEYFFNRQCDVCGTLLDEECWHSDTDLLQRLLKTLAPEDGKGEAKTPMAPVGEA